MGKRLIITESEFSEIRKMYGLVNEQISEEPICDDSRCKGKYTGPEFNNQGDIAHQYSNVITKAVAAKLKDLYSRGIYSKVDFNAIKMTTKGMGTGNVVYAVDIPFIQVNDKCDAMTGFAHVGGWGHTPELEKRKKELLNYIPSGKNENVILNNRLYISPLTKTKEGLEEYWIQWKHRDFQSNCVSNQQSTSTQPKVNQQTSQKSQSSSKSTEVVNTTTIISNSLLGLRNDLSTKTADISINTESVRVDFRAGNYSVTFSPGKTKIKKISLIFDNISPKSLADRLETLDAQNNLKRLAIGETDAEDGSPRWYALSYIPFD